MAMSRGVQVRETIELLCNVLKDNGLSPVVAETIRKAKFNEPGPVSAPSLSLSLSLALQRGLDVIKALA
jgi:hypothetical protein